jgi:hypothetical protein
VTWEPDVSGHHCFEAIIRVAPVSSVQLKDAFKTRVSSFQSAGFTRLVRSSKMDPSGAILALQEPKPVPGPKPIPVPGPTPTPLTKDEEERRQKNADIQAAAQLQRSKEYWRGVEERAKTVKWIAGGITISAGTITTGTGHMPRFQPKLPGPGIFDGPAGPIFHQIQKPKPPPPWGPRIKKGGQIVFILTGVTLGISALGEYLGHTYASDPPDPRFHEVFVPYPYPFDPAIRSAGVPEAVAAASDVYVQNELTILSLAVAGLVALQRYHGAVVASDGAAAARQYAAYRHFINQAAQNFERGAALIENLVAALRATGEPEPVITGDQVRAAQRNLATNGFPEDVLAILAWLGATPEFVDETVMKGMLAIDSNKVVGGLYTALLKQAALYRRAPGDLSSGELLIASNTGTRREAEPSSYLTGQVYAQEPGVPTSHLVAGGGGQSVFTVGNPKNAAATIQLKMRPIDLPANWKVELSDGTLKLDPGMMKHVTLTLTPNGASVRNKQYRVAVEGYIGSELIGGIELQVEAPPQPILQLPPSASLTPAEARSGVSQTPAPSASRRNLMLVLAVGLLFALTVAALVLRSWRRLRRSR